MTDHPQPPSEKSPWAANITASNRGPDGRVIAVYTEEQYQSVLDSLMTGSTVMAATDEAGISRFAVLARATRDDEYGKAYALALKVSAAVKIDQAFAKFERGGYSTGDKALDLKIDKEFARLAQWYAGKDGGANGFTDRPLVDQRTVNITLSKDADGW